MLAEERGPTRARAVVTSVFAGLLILWALSSPSVALIAQTSCLPLPPAAPTNVHIIRDLGLIAVLEAQASSCWPDGTNTGYKNAPDYPGSLTTWSGGPIKSNTTYNFIDFGAMSVGTSSSPVTGVTFHACRFKAVAVGNALVKLFGTNITFDYVSLEPGVSAPPTAYSQSYQYGLAANGAYGSYIHGLTVTHSDIWGFGNAIDVDGSTQTNPQVFRDNWIHDAAADGGSYHTDGIGDERGSAANSSYVVIDHNTIEGAGNTNGIAFQAGTYSNFTITNNLLGGFGYTVVLWAPAPNTVFTNNTFSTLLKPVFGPLYAQSFWTSTGSLWQGNRWLVPSGAAWGNVAHSGWYWLPNASSSLSNDSVYVSQTDYK